MLGRRTRVWYSNCIFHKDGKGQSSLAAIVTDLQIVTEPDPQGGDKDKLRLWTPGDGKYDFRLWGKLINVDYELKGKSDQSNFDRELGLYTLPNDVDPFITNIAINANRIPVGLENSGLELSDFSMSCGYRFTKSLESSSG
ncbi:hypothetical protein LOZ61_003286 [Ophidiomyces ophidiicola]|nr:hypothetical protein LOZ61_003286 [Ophidiomyces ophidiicola]KAI1921471.1 hypothetical protein LOZ60_006156 [Ophidiomyces ophidiicola]KAI1968248.1 hypothetical protein LOZ56_005154 [Ophidiomyces ophidiicola]KAI2028386.1 hypothetical protein LOZ45_002201 [Ophidiomyces ophidiicola]KAI2063023.1 hypothetical protein LOZ40_005618 [Ophidiomyces ophidiicola]